MKSLASQQTIFYKTSVFWNKYFEVAKINFMESYSYVANVLARSFSVFMRIWIFTQLYIFSYNAYGYTQINGLTVAMVVWTLMITQSVSSTPRPGVTAAIEADIRNGSIAYSMNKPYSYILFQMSSYFGKIIPNIITNLCIGFVTALILVGMIGFSWQGILFSSIVLFFGLIINFLISAILGLLAFWFEDVSAFRWIYEKGNLALGGFIFPIALFPDKFRIIAERLPFSQTYYSSARLAVNFDMNLFLESIKTQAVWILIFGIIIYIVFRKGVKNVSINGG